MNRNSVTHGETEKADKCMKRGRRFHRGSRVCLPFGLALEATGSFSNLSLIHHLTPRSASPPPPPPTTVIAASGRRHQCCRLCCRRSRRVCHPYRRRRRDRQQPRTPLLRPPSATTYLSHRLLPSPAAINLFHHFCYFFYPLR